MRAWQADFGGGLDSLRRAELPDPAPGSTEVVVAVRWVTLNRRDLNILEGRYPLPVAPTLVPACDASGVVVDTGAAVTDVQVGDRVVLAVFPAWHGGRFSMQSAAQLGGSLDGTLREFVVVDQAAVVAVPDTMTLMDAACLPCAGVTAWHALEVLGVDGDHTLLTTTTGAVSLFVIGYAARRGCRVGVVTTSAARADELRDLGADQVMPAATGVFDAAVHTYGDLAATIAATGVGGRVALVNPSGGKPVDLAAALFSRNVSLDTISLGTTAHTRDAVQGAAEHDVRIPVAEVYEFDDADRAFSDYASGRHLGKVVVSM